MRRAAVLLALLAGCSDPVVSQVMVIIDADETVRDQSVSLEIRVVGGGRERMDLANCSAGESCEVHREDLPIAVLPSSGLRIALAPDQRDWRRLYEVTATAYDGPNATGTAVARTRVISGYVKGETRLIRLFLQGDCIGRVCEPTETCRAGNCVDPFIPPDMLDPFIPPDSGLEDGGRDAARDAGTDAPTDAPGCTRPSDCDDGVGCTFDDCVDGTCQSTPQDSMCADDGNPCSDAICGAAGCEQIANTAPCDDGDVCNGPDQCSDRACTNVGPARCPGLTCEPDGTCSGCTAGDCPGTETCVSGSCVCEELPFELAEISCNDGVDNDCDGNTDCADPGCRGANDEVCDRSATDEDCDGRFDEGCVELDCSNGSDDDVDGATDCEDDDCTDRTCSRPPTGSCSASMPGCCAVSRAESCGTTEDYNCNGTLEDDCVPDAGGPDADACVPTVEDCSNDIDDDCDFDVDCNDLDCDGMACFDGFAGFCSWSTGFCEGMDAGMGVEVVCDDFFDGDGDGFTDCVDPDCDGLDCSTGIEPGICSCGGTGPGGECRTGTCIPLSLPDGGLEIDGGGV